MDLSRILSVAKKEFQTGYRNKIIIFLTLLMAALALVIAYFGSAARGQVGLDASGATIVSLVSLSTYIIPVIALVLGHDLIVGEHEGRTLQLMLTLPVSKTELYIGKFIGQGLSIMSSITIGFGIVGVFLATTTNAGILKDFLSLIISSNLLGLCFLSLAQLSSAIVSQRVKSIGIALFFWFFFVLIFDLLLISLLVITEGNVETSLFSYLLFLNPTDIFRVINFFRIEEAKSSFGLITLAKDSSYLAFAYASFIVWICAPLCLGNFIFKRKEY